MALFYVKCDDGCGKIASGLSMDEATKAIQDHVKNKGHRNLSMESDVGNGRTGPQKDDNDHVKIVHRSVPPAAPAAAAPAVAPRQTGPSSLPSASAGPGSAVSSQPAKPAATESPEQQHTPARPDYSKEKLPKLSQLSQVVGVKRKNACKHIGTKKMKFGMKATARGLVQRYYCYGCHGTFTSSQQLIAAYT